MKNEVRQFGITHIIYTIFGEKMMNIHVWTKKIKASNKPKDVLSGAANSERDTEIKLLSTKTKRKLYPCVLNAILQFISI